MNRIVFAGLALVLLRNCDLAGPRPSPGKVAGTWGGDNAGLIADDTSAHVHIGCTYGDVHQPIVADGRGNFDLPGEQDITAHPVDRGILHPARFSGTVLGRTMTLTVTLTDTAVTLGPVHVTLGQTPKLGPCPICLTRRAVPRRAAAFPPAKVAKTP
jgi:hypothetical protein